MDIDSNNSRIVVDPEVGSGGSYNVNGHNNVMKLENVSCEKIVIMGHNNTVSGTGEFEKVNKLVVLGHNNSIRNLMINRVEILGHNNNIKYVYCNKQPLNNGFHNKFSNVGVMEGGSDDGEGITNDTCAHHELDSSSSSSSSSDSDMEGYTTTHNFTFSTNNLNVGDILSNVNLIHNLDNLNNFEEAYEDSSNGEGDYYGEEAYEEEEEEKDPEAHISPEERVNIINSINSFQYDPKSKEDEN